MQEFQKGPDFIGVEIPEEAFRFSEAEKERKKKSSRRPQVGKDAGNLLFVIVTWFAPKASRPKWVRGFGDLMMSNGDQLCTAINAADATKVPDERIAWINTALSLTNTLWTETIILWKVGIICEDDKNKTVAMERKIIAQLVGWRDYTGVGGAASNPLER